MQVWNAVRTKTNFALYKKVGWGFNWYRIEYKKPPEKLRGGFCYPTWIRTKTSRTRICGTTVILSGNYIAKLKNLNSKKNRNFRFGFVARPGFEPRQTVPKTVVLPLYYRAILPSRFRFGSAKIWAEYLTPKFLNNLFWRPETSQW